MPPHLVGTDGPKILELLTSLYRNIQELGAIGYLSAHQVTLMTNLVFKTGGAYEYALSNEYEELATLSKPRSYTDPLDEEEILQQAKSNENNIVEIINNVDPKVPGFFPPNNGQAPVLQAEVDSCAPEPELPKPATLSPGPAFEVNESAFVLNDQSYESQLASESKNSDKKSQTISKRGKCTRIGDGVLEIDAPTAVREDLENDEEHEVAGNEMSKTKEVWGIITKYMGESQFPAKNIVKLRAQGFYGRHVSAISYTEHPAGVRLEALSTQDSFKANKSSVQWLEVNKGDGLAVLDDRGKGYYRAKNMSTGNTGLVKIAKVECIEETAKTHHCARPDVSYSTTSSECKNTPPSSPVVMTACLQDRASLITPKLDFDHKGAPGSNVDQGGCKIILGDVVKTKALVENLAQKSKEQSGPKPRPVYVYAKGYIQHHLRTLDYDGPELAQETRWVSPGEEGYDGPSWMVLE